MMPAVRMAARQRVLDLFQAGLDAVEGRHCVASYLSRHSPQRPVALFASGKAASSMARGALDALGEQLVAGLVVTKAGHGDEQLDQDPRFHCIESGHPLPDGNSLLAGKALCRFLQAVPEDHEILLLISGGTSSLVECLPEGITLDELIRTNQRLLGSGLPISEINRARQSLSLIKGGGLLPYLKGRPAQVLLISDVPGDAPGLIGSGLCYPGNDMPHHIIATNHDALQAATDRGRALGYPTTLMDEPLIGEAQAAGEAIASQVQGLSEGIYLWGGETTVSLPDNPGRGGRNQHLALAAARVLSAEDDIVILAAGTDGTDGPTGYAGAIIDPGTTARGEARGLDAGDALARADAGRFLAASGDLLRTGPTGTNVMDMLIAYKGTG